MPRNSQRLDQARFHEFREAQQEGSFLLIGFVQDVMLVVEIVKFLRQLKGVFGDEGGFVCADGGIHGEIQGSAGEKQFPKAISIGAVE